MAESGVPSAVAAALATRDARIDTLEATVRRLAAELDAVKAQLPPGPGQGGRGPAGVSPPILPTTGRGGSSGGGDAALREAFLNEKASVVARIEARRQKEAQEHSKVSRGDDGASCQQRCVTTRRAISLQCPVLAS